MPQASSSTKKLAGSAFPSQQPLLCQEKTKSLPWGGKRSWQQEAKGCSAVKREHVEKTCPASPRRLPGHLTCCHGPARAAPASMLTRWGWGARLTPGPLPSRPVPSQVVLMAPHGPGPQPLHSPRQGFQPTHTEWGRRRLPSGRDDHLHSSGYLKRMLTEGPAHSSSLISLTSPSYLMKLRFQMTGKQAAQGHRGSGSQARSKNTPKGQVAQVCQTPKLLPLSELPKAAAPTGTPFSSGPQPRRHIDLQP